MNKKVLTVFEYLNILFMGAMLIISVTGTYHHIAWYKVSFVSAIWFGCFLLAFFVLKKCEAVLSKHKSLVLVLYLLLLFTVLIISSLICANPPTSDYGELYESSLGLISGGDVRWSYFAMFKNNYLLLLLLALIRLPAYWIGFDGFYMIVVVSALCVTLTALLVFKILEHFNLPVYICFLSLVVYALFLPLYGCTYAFYSDQATILFTVLPFYLVTSANDNKKGWWAVTKCILAGLFTCMAYWLKATAIIPMIAFLIVFMLTSLNRENARRLPIVIVAFVCFMIGFEFIWRASPSSRMEDSHMPLVHWIAIGSHGNGGFEENSDYAYIALATPTIEAKKDFALSYIKSNLSEMFSRAHILRKARHNFAAGFMGLSTYIYEEDSPAFPFLSAYGAYGGYTMMIATGMYYLLLLFNIVGSVISVIRRKTDSTTVLGMTARLALFGLFVFLMFWEANNRQLYNHIPWLVITGMVTFSQLFAKEKTA